MTTLKMGNPDDLNSLQIKLLHFLAAGPQSMKQICRQLRIVREHAEKMIKPLIDNRFITKQGNSQYRNFIKPADIPAIPVMKADPEPAPAAEEKPAQLPHLLPGDRVEIDGEQLMIHRANGDFTVVVPTEYPKFQYKMGNIEVSNIEIDPLLQAHASLVEQLEKDCSLPEGLISGDKQTVGRIKAARYRNDLDQLARIYHANWFLQDDLVGMHAGEVVFQMESVWPDRLYHGVTPLFSEDEIIVRRVELGLQTVACSSCEQPMTPEDIRYLEHICSNCENLTYVDTDSTPQSAPDDLAAALAELTELKAKYARCEALGQLVAGADIKLQYLTGLRLFVKDTAPKGLFLLDEILADYHQLAGFGKPA